MLPPTSQIHAHALGPESDAPLRAPVERGVDAFIDTRAFEATRERMATEAARCKRGVAANDEALPAACV